MARSTLDIRPRLRETTELARYELATKQMLLNLSEFQLAWSRWLPASYRPVDISDTRVRPPRTIAAFSGGVDSTFTLLRNGAQAAEPRYAVDTALMVHGFDVRLSNSQDFQERVDLRCARAALGIEPRHGSFAVGRRTDDCS